MGATERAGLQEWPTSIACFEYRTIKMIIHSLKHETMEDLYAYVVNLDISVLGKWARQRPRSSVSVSW